MAAVFAMSAASGVVPALRAIRLLNSGRYLEAETYLREVVARGQTTAIRNAGRYNLAVALHRQGRFDESLAALDGIPLHELDPSLHGAANALYGWNLIFLRQNLDHAECCIRASGPLFDRPTTQFALAYLFMLVGRQQEADDIVRRVTSSAPDRRTVVGVDRGSALVIDREFESLIEEHLLGLCAYERGNLALARQHLSRVACTGHTSFYPRHAAAVLATIGGNLLPAA